MYEFFYMDLNSLDISEMRLKVLSVWWCFKECINGSWVKILAPNLQFIIWGYNAITENCSMQSFPRLKRSFMWSRNRGPITKTKINTNGVVDLLSGSSQVEVLTISYNYLQFLSETYFELGGLPFSFMKLETLRIKNPSCRLNKRYIPGIACLFKSSPKVHTLEICFSDSFRGKGKVNDKWNNILLDDSNCTEEQFWETQAQNFSPFLSHLKVANIEVGKNSINFAKFLLKYGRGLQEVILSFREGRSTLLPNSLNDTIDLLKGFPRASAYVKFSISCSSMY
ncbi:putative F-box/FBD/LRR-repeat protein At4g03220 [Rosa rugosa]|uniref:putative F-box/FBD/LRR-repeat protein At4g03220 n=1 Tax=Rosa rugosa TaxID=74645 RepID=UPI002B4135C6|nr:putative F-box/FBD/LRR-repeat protein At4g03220 [Rosa rugosa]